MSDLLNAINEEIKKTIISVKNLEWVDCPVNIDSHEERIDEAKRWLKLLLEIRKQVEEF